MSPEIDWMDTGPRIEPKRNHLDSWVEESIVAWLFLEPHAALEQGLEPGLFLDDRCQRAVKAFRSLASNGCREPVDQYAVADSIGDVGLPMLTWLTDRFIAAGLERANWRHWTKRIREIDATRKQRRAAGQLTESLSRAAAEDERDEAVAAFQRALTAIPSVAEEEPRTLWDVMRGAADDYAARVQAAARGERGDLAVSTGIEWLDQKMNGGWPRGCVSILAGRTSHGKSTIAQIVAINALKSGAGVHYFCLEDGEKMFGARMLAQVAGLRVGDNFTGREEAGGLAKIMNAAGAVDDPGRMRRFLFETDRRPLEWLIGRVDRQRGVNRTEVVFVDYLSLIPLPGNGERHNEVEAIVTRLQQAAIEQGVAYVVLHQLNRSFSGRQNKQPMLSDLRDSGAIEERAATVVFTYRPNVDDGADDQSGQNEIDDMHLVVAKNKNGPRNCMAKMRVDFARYRIVRDW